MNRAYQILIQWPRGAGYSRLWTRKASEATLEDAKEALKVSQKGWPNKGRNKGRKIFICSPERAKRLLADKKDRAINLTLGTR